MRLLTSLIGSALFIAIAHASESDPSPLLAHKPTLSKDRIVFVFAGDLWSVSRGGGEAIRLTSDVGVESDPAFSPDGTQIAFTGEYDGNLDVYLLPAKGGSPRRLTFHPGIDRVIGWTPDGLQILFSSPRSAPNKRRNVDNPE